MKKTRRHSRKDLAAEIDLLVERLKEAETGLAAALAREDGWEETAESVRAVLQDYLQRKGFVLRSSLVEAGLVDRPRSPIEIAIDRAVGRPSA